jgi:glycine/D-amino acid oxidase-like deaminating enzyme
VPHFGVQGLVISVLDSDDIQQADLRGGCSPWFAAGRYPPHQPLLESATCDALVVGAGITGAMVGERLTRQGLNVVIVDRERPGRGSTAASTAMLLWEIDRPLMELADAYGIERAVRAYRASFEAVAGLKALVREAGIACEIRDKNSLYLATGDTGGDLIEEQRLRRRAGLPGDFLDHGHLLDYFGMARAGAIISPGAADADPLQLTRELLAATVARGAGLYDAEATEFESSGQSVFVRLDSGKEIEARSVVLATGYTMPEIVHSSVHSTSSSWAMATKPQPERIWRDGVLIWEHSKQYHYVRSTGAGRIVIGGEDSDEIIEPDARDRLIPEKSRLLARSLAALWPAADTGIDYRWAGTFATTRDGLPLIGPVPGHKGIYAAYGYGGNGITFSYLAAQLIGDLIAGGTSPLLADFAIDRDPGPVIG